MNERLDWLEKAAIGNLSDHRATADYLQKEGVTTLTILLAGAAGGLAYSVKGVELGKLWLVIGSGAFSIYLFVLCALLVRKVLTIGPLFTIYNEPGKLNKKSLSLDEIREEELVQAQDRICHTINRNERVAAQLNLLRMLAISSPLVFIGCSCWVAVVAFLVSC